MARSLLLHASGAVQNRKYAQLWATIFFSLWNAACFVSAKAQTASAHPVSAATPSPTSARLAAENAPPAGPTIVYENGLLTISAHNSTLSDILLGIARQTGADIDIPPEADELVAVYLGPAPARDVVQSLLAGSRFNYVIVGSNADANRLTKILLLPLIAEKPSDQVVNTAAVQQPSVLRPEGNDIEEAVQLSENPQASPLPIRAQQQMLQQRRQMVMQQSRNQ